MLDSSTVAYKGRFRIFAFLSEGNVGEHPRRPFLVGLELVLHNLNEVVLSYQDGQINHCFGHVVSLRHFLLPT